ncbi:PaaI family thioesterase [Salipaludibacillus aurantiacus]|uniref:Acyl-coenzyme A thioesterase THEM4 n=1 Tax=Salipaludibacillus aurantiacus TaxID=1601833 RepID=A0A1H9VBJ8_9BACI|nr:PaaI family thioesterase [Salipaludibacillus aurantiacus]SES19180.1 Thioesterase superfamily protein [Salipaludibacillus aurantiacus]
MDQVTHAIQDYYPEDFAHCFGCGRMNEQGHQFRTGWDGDKTVTIYSPKEKHKAIPGFVYGGLIASLVDCHGTGSAALVKHRDNGLEPEDAEDAPRFVTGSLAVKYLKPTPQGVPLRAVGTHEKTEGKKITIKVDVYAEDALVVTGEVTAVEMPDTFKK